MLTPDDVHHHRTQSVLDQRGPRVVRELHGVLADSEQQHWTRVLAGQARRAVAHSPATTNRILKAVEGAGSQWK